MYADEAARVAEWMDGGWGAFMRLQPTCAPLGRLGELRMEGLVWQSRSGWKVGAGGNPVPATAACCWPCTASETFRSCCSSLSGSSVAPWYCSTEDLTFALPADAYVHGEYPERQQRASHMRRPHDRKRCSACKAGLH